MAKAKARNENLNKAKKDINDEHYTQLTDIEKEMRNYKDQFRGKRVYCNCDDPYESNFMRYFALNFRALGLKGLVCTCYGTSKVAGTQMTLADYGPDAPRMNGRKAYMFRIDEDEGNTIASLDDVKDVLARNTVRMNGDGDFRSEECIGLLKEADIVATNPPFSLIREFIPLMVQYDKRFIVIGPMNIMTYKDIFPLIKENKVWLGCNAVHDFIQPDGSMKKFGNILWYTNMEHHKRNARILLDAEYSPERYPRYDNYDAIEVSRVADIPKDYFEEEYTVRTKEELDALLKELDAKGRIYTVEEC